MTAMISAILRPAAPPFLRQTLESLVEWWSSSDINLDISGMVVIRVNSEHIWKEELGRGDRKQLLAIWQYRNHKKLHKENLYLTSGWVI